MLGEGSGPAAVGEPAELPRQKVGGEGHVSGWDGRSERLGTKADAQ